MIEKYRYRKVGEIEVIEIIGNPSHKTIMLLHGFGADASDLVSLSKTDPHANWIFPRGPLLIPFNQNYVGRAWFPVDIPLLSQAIAENRFDDIVQAFPPEINRARAIIDQLILDLNINRSQLILGGFSQGAILAVETALKGHESLAALLILSGTLINEPTWNGLAPHHTSTSFFQSHGSHDALLPFIKGEALCNLLKNGGLKGEFHAFQGGHEIPRSLLPHLSSFLTHIL